MLIDHCPVDNIFLASFFLVDNKIQMVICLKNLFQKDEGKEAETEIVQYC